VIARLRLATVFLGIQRERGFRLADLAGTTRAHLQKRKSMLSWRCHSPCCRVLIVKLNKRHFCHGEGLIEKSI